MLMLHDVSPDPELRRLATMFLDLIFIEEAQFSVNGIRGGGKSRAGLPEQQKHLGIKDVAYGIDGGAGRRSTLVELSDYLAPPAAILLYYSAGAEKPFAIYDHVPGEQRVKGEYTPASRLISYAYRTPYYLLGCSMKNPNLYYHPTSDQTRWSGILFAEGGNAYPAERPAQKDCQRPHRQRLLERAKRQRDGAPETSGLGPYREHPGLLLQRTQGVEPTAGSLPRAARAISEWPS